VDGDRPYQRLTNEKEWLMAQSQRSSTGSEHRSSGGSGSKSSKSHESRQRGEGSYAAAGQAIDQGREVVGQTKEQANKLVSAAQDQATGLVSSQKQQMASQLSTLSTALHDVGGQMRGQDGDMLVQYIDAAADQIDVFAKNLQEQDLGQLMESVNDFARRQPAVFMAATFAVGFLAGRLLRSSTPSYAGEQDSSWRQSSGARSDYGAGAYGTGSHETSGGRGFAAATDFGSASPSVGAGMGAESDTLLGSEWATGRDSTREA
jgi:hypothetical protein